MMIIVFLLRFLLYYEIYITIIDYDSLRSTTTTKERSSPACSFFGVGFVEAIQVPQRGLVPIPPIITQVNGITVNRIPLHRSTTDGDYTKPYCFVACSPSFLSSNTKGQSTTTTTTNFLATQVWPAARIASMILEQNLPLLSITEPTVRTICEFGCGPGLPTLTAASIFQQLSLERPQSIKKKQQSSSILPKVIATDIDPFALDLVAAAANEQNYESIIRTQVFDLTSLVDPIPSADLYLFSDVFETNAVAQGAARITYRILQHDPNAYVWVFCQSDRVQRDMYIQELRQLCSSVDTSTTINPTTMIQWEEPNQQLLAPIDKQYNDGRFQRLWLCEFDETIVKYN